MRLDDGKYPQSSFGIPPQMRGPIEKAEERRQKAATAKDEPPSEEGATAAVPPQTAEGEEEKKASSAIDPKNLLSGIGVTLDEEDFHKLLFKGYIEKDIVLIKNKKLDFVVGYKTLTAKEYNEVDELIAKDAENTPMTKFGYDTRRNLWILSYTVQKLSDRALAKPVMVGGKLDSKDTARAKYAVIEALSPWVIDEMSRVYGVLSTALTFITKDPENFFSVKS